MGTGDPETGFRVFQGPGGRLRGLRGHWGRVWWPEFWSSVCWLWGRVWGSWGPQGHCRAIANGKNPSAVQGLWEAEQVAGASTRALPFPLAESKDISVN